ncbi:MAG: phosphoadenylyl-sulfate reductase [Opitutae bacterium]|nr:phosphoadenylyl-sulfate reductase [Opitutae bacterium]
MKVDNDNFAAENAELAGLDASGRVAWALERFGNGLVMSTSFGLQSAVMLHLVREVSKDIPVIFVDTGYLFPETYEYAELLRENLGIEPKVYSSTFSPLYQQIRFGRLWEKGPEGMEKYNLVNKVEPMQRALRELGATAWLAGLRRKQSASRAERTFIEKQNGVAKIYPILDWDDKTTYKYLPDNKLPYHALEGAGYDSVGDWHSTKKVVEVGSSEETRNAGHQRECGLHEDLPEGYDFDI